MRACILVCLLSAVLISAEEKTSFRGYHVLQVQAGTKEHIKMLENIELDIMNVILFGHPSLKRPTEIGVPPKKVAPVTAALQAAGLNVTTLCTDMQEQIDKVMAENDLNTLLNNQTGRSPRSSHYTVHHNVYHNLQDVNSIIDNFAFAYPSLAVKKQLKYHSEEGRPIYYLEIGTQNANKPVIMIEALSHCREWIATAAVIYSLDTMLQGYEAGNSHAQYALQTFTWVVIPVTNPDGYEYTWTTNRMWRKNRRQFTYHGRRCTGVDLNRNYDVDFAHTGVSMDCHQDIFPGTSPFSEAESRNVLELFKSLKPRIQAYLSIHAFSQLLLYPWGYVNSNYDPHPPQNINALQSVGRLMQQALHANGASYELGTAYGVLGYAASGGADDWAMKTKPGIFVYTMELRPTQRSSYGFVLPPSYIVPTGQEVLLAFYVLAEQIPKYNHISG